jgi:hypothetical protein
LLGPKRPVVALTLLLALICAPCVAQEGAAKVTLDVEHSTVAIIARMIAIAGQCQVTVAPEVGQTRVPRFSVGGVSPAQALEMLCVMAGLELKQADEGYQITEKGAGPGPEPPPPPEPEQLPTEPLVIDDMEGDVALRWHDMMDKNMLDMVPDTEFVKQGASSGKWDPSVAAKYIFNKRFIPHDWTGYDGLAMWVHSEQATDAVMAVMLFSNQEGAEQTSFFRGFVKIDWEGWREVRLHTHSFQRIREPVGFHKIDFMVLCFEGYPTMISYVPGTVLRFDDIRAIPAEPPGDEMTVFHADSDWGCWGYGPGLLGCVQEPSKTGGRVTEWISTIAQPTLFNIAMPTDWSDYGYLNMWLWCDQPAGGALVFFLVSDDPESEGQDYYRVTFPLDWEGWKLLTFPFEDFLTGHDPVGWEKIDQANIYTNVYGAMQGEGNRILLDDMWLSKEPPEQPEGDE